MIPPGRLRRFALVLLALPVAGCDDGTALDDGFGSLDPDAVSAVVDAAHATIAGSGDANFVLSDFMFRVLGSDVDLTPGTLGRTYVWDPAEQAWTHDPDRTGAPPNGLRVVWYTIDDVGIVVPLEEIGHIDLTDADTPARERWGVVIVRTDVGTDTVADYTYAFATGENAGTRTEHTELSGVFADEGDRVDVDIALQEATDIDTGDRTYTADALFEGTQGSYRWELEGSSDAATGEYDDQVLVTVVREGQATVLDLDRTGDSSTENGTGTLAHDGTTIAHLTIQDDAYSFTRPEGGSFSGQQAAELEALAVTMLLRAPFFIISLPFIDL